MEGLEIHDNPKNKFTVVSLYYYADPAKRKPEWENTVRAGMTEGQWRKEYLIDYTALFGEKAFPEFAAKREQIVIEDIEYDAVKGPLWGGFDYGLRNPSSFHVYTYQDDAFVAIWELYKPCRNIGEFAKELKDCPYFSRIKYIAADPNIFAKTTYDSAGQAESLANLFLKEGISKFVRGSQDESTWITTLRKHWENDTFKICSGCRNMIREFEDMTFNDYGDFAQQNQNLRESLKDKNNHALDDNKYFFNSCPLIPHKSSAEKSRLDQASKWYGWGEKTKRGHYVAPPAFGGHPRRKEFI